MKGWKTGWWGAWARVAKSSQTTGLSGLTPKDSCDRNRRVVPLRPGEMLCEESIVQMRRAVSAMLRNLSSLIIPLQNPAPHFFKHPSIHFLAWPNVIISRFTFFPQPISSRPLIHVAWSSHAEFSFQWINSLSLPLWPSPVQFPWVFLPFGSLSCLCYCFHYFKNGEDVFLLKLPNLVFTLLDSTVCCLGAARWMRRKSHWFDFPFNV